MICRKHLNRTLALLHRAVAAAIAGVMLASSAGAGTLSIDPSAPSGNILASQLSDTNSGSGDGGRNYLDNGGPPGQTFVVTSAALATRFTFKGRGDSSDAWNGGVNAWEGDEVWGLQVSLVNGDGSLTPLATETATGFTAGGATAIADYLTFTLAAGVALAPGNTYAFSMYISDAIAGNDGGWFGLAHPDTDVYAGGSAINSNTSIANPGANGGGPRRAFPASGFAAPVPGGYDYVFAVQGVPEPASVALAAFGALGLGAAARRRAGGAA